MFAAAVDVPQSVFRVCAAALLGQLCNFLQGRYVGRKWDVCLFNSTRPCPPCPPEQLYPVTFQSQPCVTLWVLTSVPGATRLSAGLSPVVVVVPQGASETPASHEKVWKLDLESCRFASRFDSDLHPALHPEPHHVLQMFSLI